MIGAMLQMEECFYSLQDLPDVLWLVYNIVFACLPVWEIWAIVYRMYDTFFLNKRLYKECYSLYKYKKVKGNLLIISNDE